MANVKAVITQVILDLALNFKSILDTNFANLAQKDFDNYNELKGFSDTHANSSQAHAAEKITYNGTAGGSEVKTALNSLKSDIGNHANSSQAHPAEKITYLGTAGGTEVKTALNSLKLDIDNHANSSQAHAAEKITYNGTAGGSEVKTALNSLKTIIDNVVAGGTEHDAYVTSALVDAEGEDFGAAGVGTYLDGRMGKWERKAIEQTTDMATIGLNNFHEVGGDARGTNAVDLQATHTSNDQVAGAPNSFIAGGSNNKIQSNIKRGSSAINGHAEGYGNRVHEWHGHAEGSTGICDGKIAHAEGNTCICSSNDSHAEGNRTVAGRKYFGTGVTYGAEDAGDSLGILQFVLIPDAEGDVTSYFPNPLTDSVTTRYGVGAQIDVKGNIYSSTHTPAVWTGDVPTTPNDLKWALHSICIVRGAVNEDDIEFVDIAKADYTAGVGTKVYYYGSIPFPSLKGIYSSYAPTVFVNGTQGGNGEHSEGIFASAWGYGSHAEGNATRAWGPSSHAEGNATAAIGDSSHTEGYGTKASGAYSHSEGLQTQATGAQSHAEGTNGIASANDAHAEGYQTIASGAQSHAEGYKTEASKIGAHAEGCETKASGNYSHAEGYQTQATQTNAHAEGTNTIASGVNSHAEGAQTVASGAQSRAEGYQSIASGNSSYASGLNAKSTRAYQRSWAVGKITADGDNQLTQVQYTMSASGIGWHPVSILEDCEDGKAYNFETMVIGRQTAGIGEAIGNTFAYKFSGCFVLSGGTHVVLGTPTRILIGRSAGMSGDGLTTGCRVAWGGTYLPSKASLRMDGVADTTFTVTTYSTIQEMGL